jgi:hypothetical protein
MRIEASFRSMPLDTSWTTTRSGRNPAISSASGLRKVPTFGSFAASGGNRQNVDTPTTRSPRPSANSVSVMLGEVETMRAGFAARIGAAGAIRNSAPQIASAVASDWLADLFTTRVKTDCR